jgi:hypothetical protein
MRHASPPVIDRHEQGYYNLRESYRSKKGGDGGGKYSPNLSVVSV